MKQYYYGEWHDEGTGPLCSAKFPHASGLHWRDKPQEFKREIRYEVYKRKDIDNMPTAARKKARALLAELNALLDGYGVRARKCVVVESDWPEYEKVWQMIEERVTGTGSLSPEEVATHTHARSKPADEVHPHNVERIGEQCIDGGKCHHNCKERCFRRECCAPFSTYDGPWKYEIPGTVVEEVAPAQAEQQPKFNWEPIQALWRNNSTLDWDELETAISQALAAPITQTDELQRLKDLNDELLAGLAQILYVGENNRLRIALPANANVTGSFTQDAETAVRYAIHKSNNG